MIVFASVEACLFFMFIQWNMCVFTHIYIKKNLTLKYFFIKKAWNE